MISGTNGLMKTVDGAFFSEKKRLAADFSADPGEILRKLSELETWRVYTDYERSKRGFGLEQVTTVEGSWLAVNGCVVKIPSTLVLYYYRLYNEVAQHLLL